MKDNLHSAMQVLDSPVKVSTHLIHSLFCAFNQPFFYQWIRDAFGDYFAIRAGRFNLEIAKAEEFTP